MQTEAAGERGGNGGLRGGKSRRGGGVCPGDARLRLEKTRGTGYSPGRGLFHTGALADSCRQEFRSSFCHRAYARSAVTKTRGSAAAAGHGRAAAGRGRAACSCRPTNFLFGSRTYPQSHFHTVITPRWDGLIALLHICFHPRTLARTIHLFSTVTCCAISICWRSSKQRDPFWSLGTIFSSGVRRR